MTESGDVDGRFEPRYRSGVLGVTVVNARNLDDADMDSESDPYVVLTVDGMQRKKTTTVKDNNNPDWSEPFNFNVQYPRRSVLRAEVYDWDRWTTHDALGWVEIAVVDVPASDASLVREYPLSGTKRGGTLTLSLTFSESPNAPDGARPNEGDEPAAENGVAGDGRDQEQTHDTRQLPPMNTQFPGV